MDNDNIKAAIDRATNGIPEQPGKEFMKLRLMSEIQKLIEEETKELEHFKVVHCGLWAIDQNPNNVSLEWIRDIAFQIQYKPLK